MDSSPSIARPRIPPGRLRMWGAPRSRSYSPPPRPDELKVCDSARQASAHAILASYYHALFALMRGNERRPALPFELAIYIVRIAGLTLPYPSRDLSSLLKWRPSSFPDECGTGLIPIPVQLVSLLKTEPLSKDALRDIRRVVVVVKFLQNTHYYVST